MKFIIPIYRFQFNLLYKSGSYSLPVNWAIPIESMNEAGFPVINESIFHSKLPPFEYEEELLLLEVDLQEDSSNQLNNISKKLSEKHKFSQAFFKEFLDSLLPHLNMNTGATEFHITIQDVVRIYPLSVLASNKMASRLHSKIKLQAPVFESFLLSLTKNKELLDHCRGIKYLQEIFDIKDLSVPIPESDIAKAYDYRLEGIKAIKGDSFWTFLIAYDRHRPFPKAQIGYVYDLAEIAAYYEFSKGFEKGPLHNYLESKKRDLYNLTFEQVLDIFDKKDDFKKVREEIIQKKSPGFKKYITALIFLKAKDELNKYESMFDTPVSDVIHDLRDLYPLEVAGSIYLIGYFFSGDKFYEDYLTHIKIPIFSDNNSQKNIEKSLDDWDEPVSTQKTDIIPQLVPPDNFNQVDSSGYGQQSKSDISSSKSVKKDSFDDSEPPIEEELKSDFITPDNNDYQESLPDEQLKVNEPESKIETVDDQAQSDVVDSVIPASENSEFETISADKSIDKKELITLFLIDKILLFLEEKSISKKDCKIVLEIIQHINEEVSPDSPALIHTLETKLDLMFSERKVRKNSNLDKSISPLIKYILELVQNSNN